MNNFYHALTTHGAGFMPHGMCYAWQPGILWLNVGSDILIVIAYLSIPFALVSFTRRRADLEFRGVFHLFAAFIILCAFTHLMSVWVVWVPDYAAHGLVKFATASVSMVTAVALWPIIPRALALPSPGELRRVNEELAEVNTNLEERVADRTAKLEAKQRELLQLNKALREREAEITKLMMRDPLTELPNRRRLDEILEAEIERSRRYSHPLCIAFADIDDFKSVNDRHGHGVGDRTLKLAASMLDRHFRSTDTVARYGGDEFVVILPETSGKDVIALLDRVAARLAEEQVPDTGEALMVSMGVAELGRDESGEDVLKRADTALYKAKAAGKNRVVLAD